MASKHRLRARIVLAAVHAGCAPTDGVEPRGDGGALDARGDARGPDGATGTAPAGRLRIAGAMAYATGSTRIRRSAERIS
jgi:hypothetical protein